MAGTFGTGHAPLEPECPPSNLLGSILVTLFCCMPFGLIAIVYGILVHRRWNAGDHDGARNASDMSEKWMYGGIGAVILMAIIFGIYSLIRVFVPG